MDVRDDNIQSNRVLSLDSLLKSQQNTGCANLKVNIKAFAKTVLFTFYAFGKVNSISWDTSDFMYTYPEFKFRGGDFKSLNGYLEAIDVDDYVFYNDKVSTLFRSENVMSYGQGLIQQCLQTNVALIFT